MERRLQTRFSLLVYTYSVAEVGSNMSVERELENNISEFQMYFRALVFFSTLPSIYFVLFSFSCTNHLSILSFVKWALVGCKQYMTLVRCCYQTEEQPTQASRRHDLLQESRRCFIREPQVPHAYPWSTYMCAEYQPAGNTWWPHPQASQAAEADIKFSFQVVASTLQNLTVQWTINMNGK